MPLNELELLRPELPVWLGEPDPLSDELRERAPEPPEVQLSRPASNGRTRGVRPPQPTTYDEPAAPKSNAQQVVLVARPMWTHSQRTPPGAGLQSRPLEAGLMRRAEHARIPQ